MGEEVVEEDFEVEIGTVLLVDDDLIGIDRLCGEFVDGDLGLVVGRVLGLGKFTVVKQ